MEQSSNHVPDRQSNRKVTTTTRDIPYSFLVYLPTFGQFLRATVGKYSIYGAYGRSRDRLSECLWHLNAGRIKEFITNIQFPFDLYETQLPYGITQQQLP